MMQLVCSRCGKKFERANQYSLFGYVQCLPCDCKMLEAKGSGKPWPEPDDPRRRSTKEQSMTETTDKQPFAADTDHVRYMVGVFLAKWFGERCPDFDAGCVTCQRWGLLDKLLENPFDE